MRKDIRDLFTSIGAEDGHSGTYPAPERASPIEAMGRAMQSLHEENIRLSEIVASRTGEVDVAPKILELALDVTADLANRRSFALLYLALQGRPIALGDTIAALPDIQRRWWLQAMSAFAAGNWGGTREGEELIEATLMKLSKVSPQSVKPNARLD